MSDASITLGNVQPRRAANGMWDGRLTFLFLFSSLFVAIEGFTRSHKISYAEDTGDRQQIVLAYVFALLVLPIIWRYASSAGASVSERLLLWLVYGNIVYSKDFAYLRIPGTPIFVTEIVLAVSLWTLHRKGEMPWAGLPKAYKRWLGLYAIAGLICAVRGVLGGEEWREIARDSALVYYLLFIGVAFCAFKTLESVQRLFLIMVLASVVSTINGFAWFLNNPGLRRYVPYPIFLMSVFAALVILKLRNTGGFAATLAIAMTAFGMLLANARSIYVSLAALAFLISIAAAIVWKGQAVRLLKIAAVVFLIAILILGVAMQTQAGKEFLQRQYGELTSAANYAQDDNAIFRFFAWSEAIARFQNQPVLGEGFGVPFTFVLSQDNTRPHNTFLTILYKMGIIGFVPFASFLSMHLILSFRDFYRTGFKPNSMWLLVLISIQLSYCLFGALNLLLESPFLASMFWINIGLTLTVCRVLKASEPIAAVAQGSR